MTTSGAESAPRENALLEIATNDDAADWAAAGFAVDGTRIRLGALTIVCEGPDGSASHPTLRFDHPNPSGAGDLDGIPWETATMDPAPTALPPTHPNGITTIDHVVIMAPDLDRVRNAVLGAGLEIRRERPTRMGSTAITQVFAWAGEVLLEIVAPSEAADPTERPADLWGVAVVSPDLDATVAWFGDRSSPPKDAVQAGRRIATLRNRDLGLGLTVAVMSPHSM